MEENKLLAFFECQCRGVKFYQLRDVSARYGTPVSLQREPTNVHDALCVAAYVPGSRRRGPLMLGHVAREAARWLYPLLSSFANY